VDLSNHAVSLQANALKGFKGDFRDIIINLGDAFGIDCLFYIGEGGLVPYLQILLRELPSRYSKDLDVLSRPSEM
jgi:hypothetical protein